MQLLKFELNLKTVLWGGERIGRFKGLELPVGRTIGERWEVSGLSGHESVVAEGPDRGLTLRQLISRYRGRLVGNRVYRQHGNEFPLLVKFIDARDDLSVQVHPDDDLAMERHGCSGKAEMWYVIESEEKAAVMAGTNNGGIQRAEFEKIVTTHMLEPLLCRCETHVGDCFFLPAGTLHSICAGNLLLEVQQPSDITYRVWDYNRLDGNGQPRQLHTSLAIDAIDYDNLTTERRVGYDRQSPRATLVDSSFFTVSRVLVDGEQQAMPMPFDAFLVVVNVDGEAVLEADGVATPLAQGETVLVPAEVRSLSVTGHATLITATV